MKEAALAVGSALSGDYEGTCEHAVNLTVEYIQSQLEMVKHTVEWWESFFRASGSTAEKAEERAERMVHETMIEKARDR